jgi:hypothetical protein
MQQRKKLWSAGNPHRLAASLAGRPLGFVFFF